MLFRNRWLFTSNETLTKSILIEITAPLTGPNSCVSWLLWSYTCRPTSRLMASPNISAIWADNYIKPISGN